MEERQSNMGQTLRSLNLYFWDYLGSSCLLLLELRRLTFVGLYVPMWLGPCLASYAVFRLYDNFGLDPLRVLDQVHMTERIAGYLGYEDPKDMQLKPWQVSALFAYLVGEVTEIVRIPAVIALTPIVHKRLMKRRQALQSTQEAQEASKEADDTVKVAQRSQADVSHSRSPPQ